MLALLPLALLLGGPFLLGALELVGDGGVDRLHLLLRPLAGLPLPAQLLLQGLQPGQGLIEPGLEVVAPQPFAGEIGPKPTLLRLDKFQLLGGCAPPVRPRSGG